jgi:hypothetical protein
VTVGLALALIHLIHHYLHQQIFVWLFVAIMPVLFLMVSGVTAAIALHRPSRKSKRIAAKDQSTPQAQVVVTITTKTKLVIFSSFCLVAAVEILLVTGVAAGIK